MRMVCLSLRRKSTEEPMRIDGVHGSIPPLAVTFDTAIVAGQFVPPSIQKRHGVGMYRRRGVCRAAVVLHALLYTYPPTNTCGRPSASPAAPRAQ